MLQIIGEAFLLAAHVKGARPCMPARRIPGAETRRGGSAEARRRGWYHLGGLLF